MTDVVNVGSRIVNAWLLRLNGKTVLVDTGYAEGYAAFCKRLAKHGVKPEGIDYVFLTHAHDDHAGFLNEVLAASKAKLVLHPDALPVLRQGRNRFSGGCTGKLAYAFCLLMKLFGKGKHTFPPLQNTSGLLLLTPETRAALEAEWNARILDTPGHTACSLSLLTRDGLLFCGDAAMNGFPSTDRVTIWAENLTRFEQSWDTMLASGARTLYPGHGKPFPVDDLRRFRSGVQRHRLFTLR